MTTGWKRWIHLAWLCLIPLSGNAVGPIIAAGNNHVLAVAPDKTVLGWGDDRFGQLGFGKTSYASSPLQLSRLTNVVAVAAGFDHTLVLTAAGDVWAWGDNSAYQLGDGTPTNRSVPVKVLSGIVQISAGTQMSLALDSSGNVWQWGLSASTGPAIVRGLPRIGSVHAKGYTGLAVSADGHVWAWGDNQHGCLGNGSASLGLGAGGSTPTLVAGPSNIVSVSSGRWHCLAVDAEGFVWAWGFAYPIQGGNWSDYRVLAPLKLPGISNVFSVDATSNEHYAIKRDGSVVWWQFDPSTAAPVLAQNDRTRPILNGKYLSVGDYHGLLVDSSGKLWSVGSSGLNNNVGQLGLGDTTFRSLGAAFPVNLPGNIVSQYAVSTSENASFAVLSNGTAWAWGGNDHGQLMLDEVNAYSVPKRISGISGVSSVTATRDSSFAVLSDGSVYSWGKNDSAQLGLGDFTPRTTPTRVTRLASIVSVKSGGVMGLALDSQGKVWIWGYGNTLGWPPSTVNGLGNIIAIANGLYHSLALRADGTVMAWGDTQYGQLGDGVSHPATVGNGRNQAALVPGLSNIIAVAAGQSHSLALQSDGRVWAWGSNDSHQLGFALSVSTYSYGEVYAVPTVVPGLPPVKAISASENKSCFISMDDQMYCAGGSFGALLYKPASQDNVRSVALGGIGPNASLHYVRTDGLVFSVGDDNRYGQSGDGTFTSSSTPVMVVNETVTGFLDLDPAVPNSISASAVPNIIMEARRIGGLASLTLGANVYFGAIDLGALAAGGFAAGGPYKVFVAAIVPPGITGVPAGIYLLDTNRSWSFYAGGPLREYVSNATLDQTQHYFVSILNGTDLSSLMGARFLVGYGTDDQEMLAAQRYREIYVAQPDPTQ